MNNKENQKLKKEKIKEEKGAEDREIFDNAEDISDFKKEKAKILEKTAEEYFNSAEDEFNKGRFNSAVVLYFKSL